MGRGLLLIVAALLCAGSARAQEPPRPLWTAPAAAAPAEPARPPVRVRPRAAVPVRLALVWPAAATEGRVALAWPPMAPVVPALSVTPGLPAEFGAMVPAVDLAAAPAPIVPAAGHVDRKGR